MRSDVRAPLSVISFQARPDEYTRALTTAPCSETGATVKDLRSSGAGRTSLQVPESCALLDGRQNSVGTGPTSAAPAACALASGAASAMPEPGVVIATPAACEPVSAGEIVMPVPSPRVAAPCAWAAASAVSNVIPVPCIRAATPLACAAESGAVSVTPVPSRAGGPDGLDRARLGRGAGVDDQRVAGDEAVDAHDLDDRVPGRGGRGERRVAALGADRADRPDLSVDERGLSHYEPVDARRP